MVRETGISAPSEGQPWLWACSHVVLIRRLSSGQDSPAKLAPAIDMHTGGWHYAPIQTMVIRSSGNRFRCVEAAGMTSNLIVESPRSRRALLRGIEQMTALISPTLGPVARTVAIAGATGMSAPEVLDNAAVIARRTVELSDPFENMGAMLVRQLAWRVFESVGDGSATAAVICREVVRAASPYIAAGGNPMLIKRGLEQALKIALAELKCQSREVQLPAELARMVAGTLREPGLAEMIGEIVETVGADGSVVVENSPSTTTAYEYVEGVQWESGYLSYALLRDGEPEMRLANPRILLIDKKLSDVELVPLVELCVASDTRSLLIIAPGLSDAAVAFLNVNRDRVGSVMAARAPLSGVQRDEALLDLAAVTGGRFVQTEVGDRIADIVLEDFGTARQAWVNESAFGIIGGGGDRGAIRQRVVTAKAHLRQTQAEDQERQTIRDRIGKLTGASAVIHVGAPTTTARAELRSRIEMAIASARAAFQDGGVPGGGAAYLHCIPALEDLHQQLSGDEAVGVAILISALSSPAETIAANAGVEPSVIAAEAARRPPGFAFDVRSHEWVDAMAGGIVDPLPVVTTALEASVSAAAMAITTDVLVRSRRPKYAIKP